MIPQIVRDRLEDAYGFMLAKSSLLAAPYKEYDLTDAITFTNKIPLTIEGNAPYTTVYNTHLLKYHAHHSQHHNNPRKD